MKFFLISIFSFILSQTTLAQTDTVRVEIALFLKDAQYESLDSSSKGYSFNGKRISHKSYQKKSNEWDLVHQKVNSYKGKYCLFVDSRGRVRAEGKTIISDVLLISGPYKEYYKNGKLKVEGAYSTSGRNSAIHEWKIYNKNGKIICSCNFDKFTRLVFYTHYTNRKLLKLANQKPKVEDICKCDVE